MRNDVQMSAKMLRGTLWVSVLLLCAILFTSVTIAVEHLLYLPLSMKG